MEPRQRPRSCAISRAPACRGCAGGHAFSTARASIQELFFAFPILSLDAEFIEGSCDTLFDFQAATLPGYALLQDF